ncbi:MAG TPA: response regulator [Chitinispirillaceae bacterium]|nr:response regulator [Chitinispirillaceae bacterium]
MINTMRRLSTLSEENLRARLIHEDSERFRRAIIVAFSGVCILLMIAWLLLSFLSLDLLFPVAPLKYLAASAFVVSSICLALALFSRKLQLAMSVMSIFISLQFIPTLIFTGGFISPFVIIYMLSILLSFVLVDLIPIKIGLISFSVITGSYIVISLVQKAGMIPYKIDYVEQLLKMDYFFWLVFSVVCFSFIHGFISVYGSSRNIRDTLTQMIMTYRHVAEGTAVFSGKQFTVEICDALRRALGVSNAFLIEIDGGEKHNSLVSAAGAAGRTQFEQVIASEFKCLLTNSLAEINIMKMREIIGFPLPLASSNDYVFWTKINDASGTLCAVLGIIDSSVNKMKGVLANDILQIFANRISSEFARIKEEKKRLQMQQLFGQGQKMQAVGKLASVIAHDFNNVLNGIFGFASLIKKNAGPDSAQTRYVEKIFQLGNNATALIAQLLSYSRAKPINFVSFDISEITGLCLEIIRLTLKKKIKITNEGQPGIHVFGDASMIQSALLNLALNGCDSIENQGELNIKTESKQLEESDVQDSISGKFIPSGRYIVVSVSDTGCGIPEEQLKRIFEPFYTTKAVGQGSGLGLAAVVGCMDAHKGFIVVSSIPGSGSTFYLYFRDVALLQGTGTDSNISTADRLNIEDGVVLVNNGAEKLPMINKLTGQYEHDFKMTIEAFDTIPDSGKSQLRRKIKKVLIVDDDIMILDSIGTFLNNLEYNSISCNSGETAIQMFETNKDSIDIVILDMIIPDVSGRVLFDRFREFKPEIKIVMMTGFSDPADIEYVKKQGAITVLNKPFECSVIDRILLDIASGIQE